MLEILRTTDEGSKVVRFCPGLVVDCVGIKELPDGNYRVEMGDFKVGDSGNEDGVCFFFEDMEIDPKEGKIRIWKDLDCFPYTLQANGDVLDMLQSTEESEPEPVTRSELVWFSPQELVDLFKDLN